MRNGMYMFYSLNNFRSFVIYFVKFFQSFQ